MKKKILLIDESLTVQKVVSLTLDKSKYQLLFAKNRSDVMKMINESIPDLILVSDQVSDIDSAVFPKEVEMWLSGKPVPPMVLITAHDLKTPKHYAAVLKKPFTPQTLKTLVSEYLQASTPEEGMEAELNQVEDQRFEKMLEHTFLNEAELVKQTFESNALNWKEKPESSSLWKTGEVGMEPMREQQPLNPSTKNPIPEAQEQWINASDLEKKLESMLSQILPNIVERVVEKKLDQILKDQEQYI
jgi:CheY-like chemotaxis protein